MQYTKITQTNRIEMEEFVMKDFLKKIYSLISTMLIALSDYLQSAHEQKQQQQLAIQQQNQNYCIRSVAYKMQSDLFEIFNKRQYFFLHPIISPADIRFRDYEIRGNTVVFKFELAKSTCQPVDATIAQKVMQNMNEDIEQAIYRLSVLGTLYDYPFLSCGLKVVGVKDAGLALEISVITNYSI